MAVSIPIPERLTPSKFITTKGVQIKMVNSINSAIESFVGFKKFILSFYYDTELSAIFCGENIELTIKRLGV